MFSWTIILQERRNIVEIGLRWQKSLTWKALQANFYKAVGIVFRDPKLKEFLVPGHETRAK